MTYDHTQTNARSRKARRRWVSSTQVMFAAILAIGLILAINFSSRIADDRELQAVRDAVLQEIELLQREQQNLMAQLAYVSGDAYVEEWARSEGRMVRDGEVLIRPVPASDEDVTAVAAVEPAQIETAPPRPQPWELWWALFFDDSAPTPAERGAS